MARLSSPDSALQKLEESYEKINELFETVDDIQTIRSRIDNAHKEIQADETRLREKIDHFEELGKAHEKAVERLNAAAQNGEQETKRLIAAFEDEQKGIHETLERLLSEQRDIEAIRKILDDELENIKADVDNKTAYFVNLSESSIGNARSLITQAVVEGRQTIEEVIDTAREDLKSFRKHVNQYLNEKIDELSDKLAGFQDITEKDLNTRFAEEKKSVHSAVNGEIKTLHTNYNNVKLKIDESMQILQTEREDIMDRRRSLEQEMVQANEEFSAKNKHFNAELEKLIAVSRTKIDQSVENGGNIMEEEVNHINAFIDGSEKEIGNLKNDLVAFKDGMDAFLNAEVKEMYRQVSDFQSAAQNELTEKFVEETKALKETSKNELQAIVGEIGREKIKINETLQGLKSDKKAIGEARKQFGEEMQQLNRRISDKTVHFTNQLKKLIMNSQQKITQATNDANNQVDGKLRQFSSLLETSKAEMRKFKKEFETFKKETDEWMKQKAVQFTKQQSGFQQAAMSKVTSRLSEESIKIKKGIENDMLRKMDDYMNRQKTVVDNLIQQIDSFDRRVSVIKTEHGEALLEHKQKDARMSGYIEELTKKQSRQENMLPEIDKRFKSIEARFKELENASDDMRQSHERQTSKIPEVETRLSEIEQRIEEMLQKRGIFSFAKS